jgi:hypothetical protein
MDLLRFDSKELGPIFVDGRALILLTRDGDGEDTNLGIMLGSHGLDIVVAGDPDEVALAIERSVPGARVHRIT